MTQFRQRWCAVWGSAQAQDIAEYAAMLAVILLLIIGTVKLIGKHRRSNPVAPATPSLTR
jgi:hypothetical protein